MKVICVTKTTMERLQDEVAKKEGFCPLGKPLKIGRDGFVQRMVKIPLCTCGELVGETGLCDRCAATVDIIAALNDCHYLPTRCKMTVTSPGKVLVSESQVKKYGEQFLKNINGSKNIELVVVADEALADITLKEKMDLLRISALNDCHCLPTS